VLKVLLSQVALMVCLAIVRFGYVAFDGFLCCMQRFVVAKVHCNGLVALMVCCDDSLLMVRCVDGVMLHSMVVCDRCSKDSL